MRIHPVAELKCNSQSARRRVTGTTREWIGPFVLEGSYSEKAPVRWKLDWHARGHGRWHFALRPFQEIESRGARLRFAIESEAGAGQSRVEDGHAMERQRHPSVNRPFRRAPSTAAARYTSHRPYVHVAGLGGLDSFGREIRFSRILGMHFGAETATHDRIVEVLDDVRRMRAVAFAQLWIFNNQRQ